MAALQEALAAFNKTIDNKPNTADFYYMRGVTSIQFIHFYNRPFTEEVENIFNEAIKDFESTLKYDESFFIAYAGIGNAYDRYGLFDKAIKWYDKTLEHKDDIEKDGAEMPWQIFISAEEEHITVHLNIAPLKIMKRQ
ncbi:MAG: hypothetical protein RQM95_08830 [Syntrophaceticus schinkii]